MFKEKLTTIKSDFLAQNKDFNIAENVHPLEERIVLKNYHVIDPESIIEYIANDGYFAIEKALRMTQEEVIDEVVTSKLRGRGGVGFPTGLKWKFAHGYKSDEKYVICNADEGEPGTFMDRHILEGDPHNNIEGMMIAGYAIGADKGYIYVRAEYPLAASRLQKAIDDCKELGILGENIFGTNFSFDVEIRLGAGAFICGEETALMESIEGKRGLSRNKPPFPAEIGLFEQPTVINNVETIACISSIILKGGEWFASIGTKESTGTKVFSLSGKTKNNGIFEVPMGITLKDVVYQIGGGMKEGSSFKAAFTGGPSGGILAENHMDAIIDFNSLRDHDSIMGSGGIIIADQDDCIVDTITHFMKFNADESCGKCTPCREGTEILHRMLKEITTGNSSLAHLEKLTHLSKMVATTSLCGLGQAAPDPIFSALNNFHDEFMEHVIDKKCKTGVCNMPLKGGE